MTGKVVSCDDNDVGCSLPLIGILPLTCVLPSGISSDVANEPPDVDSSVMETLGIVPVDEYPNGKVPVGKKSVVKDSVVMDAVLT